MKEGLSAEDLKRAFESRRLLAQNSELRSQLNQKTFQLTNYMKKQEQMVNNEVKLRTKELETQHKEEIKELNKKHQEEIEKKDKELEEKDKEIKELKERLMKTELKLDTDSTNSGLPTSKTPIGKKKHIPNTREKTDKKIGGQEGHKKHKLKPFSEEEITEVKEIIPTECSKCGSNNLEKLNTSVDKQELDFEVVVIKRKNRFVNCRCKNCGNEFHAKISNDLKEDIQYGKIVQALAVCLTNEIYTPFNKTVKLIQGITDNEINMSEGYVTKLQIRANKNLDEYIEELKEEIIKQPVLGWDDGVIDVNTKQAVLRTYCTDNLAIFMAHKHKNEDSLDEDGILTKLSEDTILMHDHLLHNYNDKYIFKNVECAIHLMRRLKKSQKESPDHSWQEELLKFLSELISDRNKILKKSKESKEDIELKFSEEYLKDMEEKYDSIIKLAKEENERDSLEKNYFKEEEAHFIEDLIKYKKNYLLWAYDFSIPNTNNACERKIRPVKSKLKISGQFKNIEYAGYYAKIRSYIETCKMNGINIIDACIKLMNGKPYSVKEILAVAPKKR